jgi:hypothetical protein
VSGTFSSGEFSIKSATHSTPQTIICEADKTSRPLNFPEKVHKDCLHYFFGPDFKDPC